MMFTTPDNTLKILTTVLVLVLSTLACGQYVTPTPAAMEPTPPPPTATATPTQTPRATATSEDVSTLTIQAVVYIRAEADANSDDVGSLQTGAEVELRGECSEAWCPVRVKINGKPVDGWVFRGCTSDPNGLLCEAR
jgi:hypothetical protein